jgi:hypothetical protein
LSSFLVSLLPLTSSPERTSCTNGARRSTLLDLLRSCPLR